MPFTSNAKPGKRNAVMLVERNSFTRRLIRGMLKEIGIHSVIEARDGATAEHMLKTNPVDAILLDWRSPGTESARMLARLRQADNPKTAVTPVIITSAHVDLALLERAANLDASSVMLKPFSLNVLRSHVLAVLGEIDAKPLPDMPPEADRDGTLPVAAGNAPAVEDSEIFYL